MLNPTNSPNLHIRLCPMHCWEEQCSWWFDCRVMRRCSVLKQCIRLYMSANADILKLQQRGLLQNVFPDSKLVALQFLVCDVFSHKFCKLLVPWRIVVPSVQRLILGDRAFPVAASRSWNSLPPAIRNVSSFTSFRQQLKTHLFRLSFGYLFTTLLTVIMTL